MSRVQLAPSRVGVYCDQMIENQITVNRSYQRNDEVWSSASKSYFIETVILGYPMPRMFLFVKTDTLTRRDHQEIVDGQQRSFALKAFYEDKLRLGRSVETERLRNKKYSELDDNDQTAFLNYSLPISEFVGVDEEYVRVAFRRMNSTNASLNAEEKRNARFQGAFKWALVDLANDYSKSLTEAGLFSNRNIIRMVDHRVYAEILYVLLLGKLDTVKAKQIDSLYSKFDDALPDIPDAFSNLRSGLNIFLDHEEYHDPKVLRGHVFQSLILAIIDTQGIQDLGASEFHYRDTKHPSDITELSVDDLISAMNAEKYEGALADFLAATTSGTNTDKAKSIRYDYFRAALS